VLADRADHIVRGLAVDCPYGDIRPAFLELLNRLVDQIDGWLSDNELLHELDAIRRGPILASRTRMARDLVMRDIAIANGDYQTVRD
jgi:hypothetical protein